MKMIISKVGSLTQTLTRDIEESAVEAKTIDQPRTITFSLPLSS